MTPTEHHPTAAEDRLSIGQKAAYGLGAITNNLLGGAIGHMSIVLNVGLGMNPALVGTLQAVPRFTDAFTDPVMGFISDNARTRYGRRRPFIFVGAILVGLIFAAMWQLPPGRSEMFYFGVFLASSVLFYLVYTVFATPWVALGYEMTPDYHERTRLMAVSNVMGQFAWITLPWFYAIMENDRLFEDSVEGARVLAVVLGVFVAAVGVVPAIFCRERYRPPPEGDAPPRTVRDSLMRFFRGFGITIRRRDFLRLCAGTFLVFNGWMLVNAFGSYITIFYVCGGDQDHGARYMGLYGTISTICNLVAIPAITWLSTRIGKRRAFLATTSLGLGGSLVKWWCYDPAAPWKVLLPAPLAALGGAGLFTLMGSMIADVCDMDELETGQRREGMYGSIFWWMIKLGMAMAFGLSGYLLNATGFKVELGGGQSAQTFLAMRAVDVLVPALTAALAIVVVRSYTITEARANQIRAALELRKGAPPPAQ